MIQMQTNLDVADNSGAKVAYCFRILGGSKRHYASIGDVIKVSIKSAIPGSNTKKKTIHNAVIVRTKKEIRRPDGTYIRFDENACVLIQENGEPKATRIFGPVARELRERNFMKIVSLAQEVV